MTPEHDQTTRRFEFWGLDRGGPWTDRTTSYALAGAQGMDWLSEDRGPIISASEFIDRARRRTEGEPLPVPVGSVQQIKFILGHLGLRTRPLALPPASVAHLWGRQLRVMKHSEAIKLPRPVFVKPLVDKAFSAQVWTDEDDEVDLAMEILHLDDPEVITSEEVDIVAEWRVMVHRRRSVAVRHYQGDPLAMFDADWIGAAVPALATEMLPTACAVDVARLADGRMVVVEVNDAYALGEYGTSPHIYAKMLAERWEQITRGEG